MKTLKEARRDSKKTQADLARALGINIPKFCNAEQGAADLGIINCLMLEEELDQPILWRNEGDPLTPEEAKTLFLALSKMTRFPTLSLLNFAARVLSTPRLGQDDKLETILGAEKVARENARREP